MITDLEDRASWRSQVFPGALFSTRVPLGLALLQPACPVTVRGWFLTCLFMSRQWPFCVDELETSLYLHALSGVS